MTFTGESALIGGSPAMRGLRRLIATVAPTRLAVLIYGETGTGKELVAAEIHARSERRGAFVPFNVCAVGETMFEDALFGHVRGAYTGAMRDAAGFLREAEGGTVFLDEISGLGVSLQAKLLRAIETGIFRPLGAQRDARSDFRVVAATNERINVLVNAGRFRADLAHRLGGVVIVVPPLSERREDIPALVDHFLRRLSPAAPLGATGAALARLWAEDWPGNIRELRQVVETAAIFAEGTLDEASIDRALAHRAVDASDASDANERSTLGALLEDCAWDIDRVASLLGVHRATVYRRMKRCGLSERADATFRRIVATCDATKCITRDNFTELKSLSDC